MKGKIVVLKSGDFRFLARITEDKTTQRWFRREALNKPEIIEGVSYTYLVREFERDLTAKTDTLIRYAFAINEDIALQVWNQMQEEYKRSEQDAILKAKALMKSENAKLKTPPPPQCDPITQFDISDHVESLDKALRETYPRVFAAFDKLKAAKTKGEKEKARKEIEANYLLDVAVLTGVIHGDQNNRIPEDQKLILALSKELNNFKRSNGTRSKVRQRRCELLRGWFKEGYCFLSHTERAEKINKTLGMEFSVEDYRADLKHYGLVTKRKSGPPESDGWKNLK